MSSRYDETSSISRKSTVIGFVQSTYLRLYFAQIFMISFVKIPVSSFVINGARLISETVPSPDSQT